MPGKKKKYNARFPPARIKKIMQSDEEVGKVAAAVPVIISRALELFVENLLSKANNVINQRGSRILTPSHIKLCIQSEKRFDFLKELVSSVPDLQGDTDCPDTPMSAGPSTSSLTSWQASSSAASAAAPSTAPASLSGRREFVFPPEAASTEGPSSRQPLSRTSSTESSRNEPQHMIHLLQQQQHPLPSSSSISSVSKSKRGPRAGQNAPAAATCNSRSVGRPKKSTSPGSVSSSSLPHSLQPIAIKPKKPHPAVAPIQPLNHRSDKRQLTTKQHKHNNNGNSSSTSSSGVSETAQYYPVQLERRQHKLQLQSKHASTGGTARNVGHINDEDDDDVDMAAAPANGGGGGGGGRAITSVSSCNSSGALDLSVPRNGAASKELPVLISTPTFVLSYPSFTVSAAAASTASSAAAAAAATSAPSVAATNPDPTNQGCDADTGVLVIDEDYEC